MLNTIHNVYSPHHLPSKLKQRENNIFYNLANGLIKLTQYILNNPGKALTLGLTSQVLASSALNFQDPSSVRNANLTQKLHLTNPLLNDSLTLIAQRALPTLNLTWLNQTDINQMELVPEAWLNTNDTFLNKNLHRTKRDGQRHLEKEDVETEDAIEDCITAIRNEDFAQAGKIWHDLMILDYDEVKLRKIIERVYSGNVCNFDKLESFIREGLNSVGSKLVACQLLLAEIIKYDQLFTSQSLRLAYNFRQFMRNSNYLKLTPEFKLLCESEKSKFPQAIKYLLGNRFCLKSMAHNNEYLYASWFKMPNNRENRVFTWVPSKDAGEEAVWRVESSDNGKTFYLFNPKQHAYLHATKDQYDDDRRYIVGLPVRNMQGKWRIQLVAASEIILLNDYYGETLYNSFKYNDNRRYVFTWLKGPIRAARWKVENCGTSRRRREIPSNLEDTTSPAEFAFFKRSSNQINSTSFEARSIPELDSRAETQVTSSPLNRTAP